MTKAEEFLWIVQTTILANAVNIASVPENIDQRRHIFSATGTLIHADEAVRASKLIPADMTAFDAANEFCTFSLPNLRELEERAHGEKMTVPAWFARG